MATPSSEIRECEEPTVLQRNGYGGMNTHLMLKVNPLDFKLSKPRQLFKCSVSLIFTTYPSISSDLELHPNPSHTDPSGPTSG